MLGVGAETWPLDGAALLLQLLLPVMIVGNARETTFSMNDSHTKMSMFPANRILIYLHTLIPGSQTDTTSLPNGPS